MAESKFTQARQLAIVAAVTAGVSMVDAARGNDVAPSTVKSWLAEGRADPDSKYADFAAAIDAAIARREETPADAELPSRTELFRRLDAASKKGSVRATQLLLEERAKRDKSQDESKVGDEFDHLDPPPDELGRRRRSRQVAPKPDQRPPAS